MKGWVGMVGGCQLSKKGSKTPGARCAGAGRFHAFFLLRVALPPVGREPCD